MRPHYKHIIWDWNGTLLDDTALCVEVLNELLTRRDKPRISRDFYRNNFGFPVIHFYEQLGFDTERDSFAEVSAEFMRTYEERWLRECGLHSGAGDVLRELGGRGLTHSVLSAAKQEALDEGLRHFQLDGHFTEAVGADNILAHGKLEQGRAFVGRLRRRPEEVVLIGDTLHDHEVASMMGSWCILLAHGHHSPERLERSGAPVVGSLPELLERLDSF